MYTGKMNTVEISERYLGGESTVEIGRSLGVPPSTVAARLVRSGVKLRSNKDNSRKYTLDHLYFSNIDCPRKSYWLGFMYADGYVSAPNKVGVALSVVDEQHLIEFSKDIQSDYPIHRYFSSGYSKSEYSRLLVTSDRMFSDLVGLGCVEKKTGADIVPPGHLAYERDFIRGYVDGDGSIKISKGSRSGYRLSLCGPRSMLEWVSQRVPRPAKIYQSKSIFQSDMHSDNIKYLYQDDDFGLSRKVERARLCV